MRHSGVLPGISLYKNRKINRHALHFVGGIFSSEAISSLFLRGTGFFCPDSAPCGHSARSGRALLSPCRALLSPRRAMSSPCRALFSPRRALLSPRRALLSPAGRCFHRVGCCVSVSGVVVAASGIVFTAPGIVVAASGVVFTASGVVVAVSGVVVAAPGDGSACLPPVETYSGRKKVRKPSASGLFFGLSVANYFARAFRLTSLAALSASFGFFEMALLS